LVAPDDLSQRPSLNIDVTLRPISVKRSVWFAQFIQATNRPVWKWFS
jgi:hypothetical protein